MAGGKAGVAFAIGFLWTQMAAVGASSFAVENSDEVYRKGLIGVWVQKDVGPAATLVRKFAFHVDGSYRSDAKLVGGNEAREYQNRGRWSIEGGVLYITVLESTSADVPLGHTMSNQIVALTKDEVVTESKGIETTAHRVR